MIEREFIKVVFLNNPFNLEIDVFSLPIISTILTSFDNPHQEYIKYERGSDFPFNLRNNYSKPRYQYELFEFAYQRHHYPGYDILDNNNNTKDSCEYEWNKFSTSCDHGKLDKYKKEISWCVFQNSRRLHKIGSNNTRYCYVNTKKNINIVTTSPCAIAKFEETCLDIETTDESSDPNNILGYMKVFSTSAKNSYISSLNYRNCFNLFNHIMLYFDIKKYCQMNSAQIFKIPFNVQVKIINLGMYSLENENRNNDKKIDNKKEEEGDEEVVDDDSDLILLDDDEEDFDEVKEDENFENIQILLYDEVLSSRESVCCEMLPLSQTYLNSNFNCTSNINTNSLLCNETMMS